VTQVAMTYFMVLSQYFPAWIDVHYYGISQGNGPIRHVKTYPDFFTARVNTTKYTLKILAANTHCKYFLKIAEVTHLFCTRNRLYQRFVQPS
jgi:hypothetical protein